MKTSIIFLTILCFFFLPGFTSALFGGWIKEPERNNAKIEANKELTNRFLSILPPGTKISSYPWNPHLDEGHKATRSMSFDLALPNVVTNDSDEALKLFIYYFDKIIEIVNTTPKIRPYLESFPINSTEFCVSIIFNNNMDALIFSNKKNKIEVLNKTPYIGAITFQFGKITIIRRVYKEELHTWKSEECTSIDAQEIFNTSIKKSFFQKTKKQEIAIPNFSKYENLSLDGPKNWFSFWIQYAQREKLIYLFEQWYLWPNLTTYEERIHQCLGSTYCAQEKRLSLDEAKAFIRKAYQDHLAFYRKDETAIRQIKKCQTDNQVTIDGKARKENLSLRFIFWDKYIDRIQPPYIAEIYTFGKKVYYFTSDEYQQVVLLAQEELSDEENEANNNEPIQ